MRNNKIRLLKPFLMLTLILVASSCQQEVKLSDEERMETAAVQDQLDLVDTAVFETEVVALLTEWAPTATLTLTPSPTFTLTPIPSLTPTITETVYKNPWILQDVCVTETPSPCVVYKIHNNANDTWINVVLTDQISGESGMFSIPAKTTGFITLLPHLYKATYTATCKISVLSITKVWHIYDRTDTFYCSTGGSFRLQ